MKVIFLDIDGVLNCKKTPNPRSLPYMVDRRLLARFKRLLKFTRAKVVLTSTWRYDPAGLFSAKRWGIPFISVTPDMPKRPRHDEIRAWLKKHPQVTRFVVIDDEDDGLDDLPLFQPSATTGLTGEIVRSVVQYLDGKTDKDMRSSRVERLLQNVQSARGAQGGNHFFSGRRRDEFIDKGGNNHWRIVAYGVLNCATSPTDHAMVDPGSYRFWVRNDSVLTTMRGGLLRHYEPVCPGAARRHAAARVEPTPKWPGITNELYSLALIAAPPRISSNQAIILTNLSIIFLRGLEAHLS